MAAENLEKEMVVTYAVAITNIERTKGEAALLDGAISTLRNTQYSIGSGVAEARFGTSRKMMKGKDDIFVAKIEDMEGRVQTAVGKALASGMALGKKAQAATLRAAITDTGLSGKPIGRKGSGREVSGELIRGISTNVETEKVASVTTMVAWHGWQRDRPDYFKYQEEGTKGRKSGQQPGSVNRKVKKRRKKAAPGRGIKAANSLGAAIIIVREHLKRELGGIK